MAGTGRLHPGPACGDEEPPRRDRYDCCRRGRGRRASRLGFATEIIGLDRDLAGLEALPAARPLLVFNLVDAVDGDCRLAPFVPARLDALGLPYTGAGTSAWLETLSKIGTKLKLAHAGLPTPDWSADGTGLRPRRTRHRQAGVGAWLARPRTRRR